MIEEEYPKMYLYRRVVNAKLYIDEHYAEQLNLNSIAENAHFSKFHFLRLFKSSFNCTPHQYLIKKRVERARDLLKTKAIDETCSSVGFESIPSFTRLFKHQVGITPAKYKEQYQITKTQQEQTPLQFVPNCFAESFNWKE